MKDEESNALHADIARLRFERQQTARIKELEGILKELVAMYEDQIPTYSGHEILEKAKEALK